MIKIVDYGLGNLSAFLNVYKRLNIEASPAKTAEELRDATKLVLPGVGAFDRAMELLTQSGMRETLDDLVLNDNVPVLGVCVGMQILAQTSDEGSARGLGWLEGTVRAFKSGDHHSLPVPHMGWNDVYPQRQTNLFSNLAVSRFYFLHSYYFSCENPIHSVAMSNYGMEFSCAVNKNNIFGVQFHPEKSHHFGVQLLKNFAGL